MSNKAQQKFQKQLTMSTVLLLCVIFLVLGMFSIKGVVYAQEKNQQIPVQEETVASPVHDAGVYKFAFLSAAIAVAIGSIGAGIAVGYVGAAAMGALGEKPDLAGKALLFVGLAEGIAIYGLIIAIMILGKV